MNLENAKADLANLVAYHEKRLPALANLQWWYGYFGKHRDSNPEHDPAEHNYCGTSACAGGIMALAPGSGYDVKWLPWENTKELIFTWPENPDTVRQINASAVAAKWGLSEWDATRPFCFRLKDILLRMDAKGTGEVPIEAVIKQLERLITDMEAHHAAIA